MNSLSSVPVAGHSTSGPNEPRRIQALHEDVVNKIAAGEIIVAPVHALKELIENAVDAGSTSLDILVKEGGLKLLQITDNGCGIDKDDLAILCERFTTSKLKEFEDLQAIGTYGFRGEALASISHIAHLTVTTKTATSACAWKAHYTAGKLSPAKPGQSAEPKPSAGKPGTQITVEDLFYNMPSRKRAFRAPSEEYARIVDLVGRYAVHCRGVAFSCKKHGEAGTGIAVPVSATLRDRIRLTHNSALANDLVEFDLSNEHYRFKANAFMSNANYVSKRTNLLLFINHRSVESSTIKKAVEQVYGTFLPKGNKPFVYLSLEIDPAIVDVNVHPTKREVNFLNEEEIVEFLCKDIQTRLGSVDTSRTFMTQSLLSGARMQKVHQSDQHVDDGEVPRTLVQRANSNSTSTRKPYENNLIRTDTQSRKITAMLPQLQHPSLTAQESTSEEIAYEYIDREPVTIRLTTIKELRTSVRDDLHHGLSEVFANLTFVGIVDDSKRIAAVQSGVRLFLIDYGLVSAEYFYQLGLTDFGNFGSLRFEAPMSLRSLLEIAIAEERKRSFPDPDIDWEQVIEAVADQLITRREMLAEYFGLEITKDGDVAGLPLMVKGYLPSMAKLPGFLLRLGPHVVWTDEKDCFDSFLREMASFYVPEGLLPAEEADSDEAVQRRRHLHRAIEVALFPAFKSRLVPTNNLLRGVIEVANLKGLYRVFERC